METDKILEFLHNLNGCEIRLEKDSIIIAPKRDFKEGDIISIKSEKHMYIAVFKSKDSNYIYFHDYYDYETGIFDLESGREDIYSVCSLANEKQLMKFHKEAAKIDRVWNEEKKCLDVVRWRAKIGKIYYSIDQTGEVVQRKDDYGSLDSCCYNIGNYFRTEEIAKDSQIFNAFKH